MPEVFDRLGPDRELDGGADRPQLEELRRELVAHEAADVGIVVGGGGVGLGGNFIEFCNKLKIVQILNQN